MEPAEKFEEFLKTDEMRVLTEISRLRLEGDVPYAGRLAKSLGLDPSFLSKKLDEFEESGLVDRSERLGNLKLLELTDEGELVSHWCEEVLSRVEDEKRFDRRAASGETAERVAGKTENEN